MYVNNLSFPTPDSFRNSYLCIDTGVLKSNACAIAEGLPEGVQLIPVLKDNAYGLGAVPVARALEETGRVSCFAVAHISEGLELRSAGLTRDIIVMGNVLPRHIETAVGAGLTLTAPFPGFIEQVSNVAQTCGTVVNIQLKIETGLHRNGFAPGAQLEEAIAELRSCRNIRLTGVYSHFSDGENPVLCEKQFGEFTKGVAQLEEAGITVPMRHICASAALECHPEYALDAVRIGRRLYFDNPLHPNGGVSEPVSWRTFVMALYSRRKGDTLGYGGAVTLDSNREIAVIGIGYGDGLLPAFGDVRAPVLISGVRCPVLYCCMDQSLVDVTGVACSIGDEVTIFGRDSAGNFISGQEQANLVHADEGCGITAGIGPRTARVYSEWE